MFGDKIHGWMKRTVEKKKKKKRTILRRLVFDPIERLPPFIFFNRRSTGSLPLGEKEKKKEKKEKKGKEKEEKKKKFS